MAFQCLGKILAMALVMVLITVSNDAILKLKAHNDFGWEV